MIRFIYLWTVLFKFGFLLLLLRLGIYKQSEKTFLKQFFEEAGGSFIKFGQLLALRVDVLPKAYAMAMFDLLDHVRPFPYDDVKEIFIEDLGTTPEKIFKDFQKEPFASGAFGQVHAAKLEDDTIVAVKILRPGLHDKLQADFLMVDIASSIGQTFFKISGLNWKGFAKEFKKWTLQEIDYHKEAENSERLLKTLEADRQIIIPKIYSRYSTKRILVQEYIDGFPLTRVLRGLKEGKITREELLDLGVDLKDIPHILTYEILHQYFFDGFFHADLHPGNIILLQNGKVGLVDFGIMGEWVANNQMSFLRFAKSVGDFNFKQATEYFADVVSGDLKQMIQSAFPASIEQKQVDEFIRILTTDFSDVVEQTARSSSKDLKAMKTDWTVMFMRIIGAAEIYRIKLPQDMTIFLKAFSTLGFVAKEMDPDYSLTEDFKRFFELHPEDTIPNNYEAKPYRRISRDKAIQQLNDWMAYLIEVRPDIYKLVHSYIARYSNIDT